MPKNLAFGSPVVGVFSPSSTFLMEGVLGSKTYLVKFDGTAQKPRGRPILQTCTRILLKTARFPLFFLRRLIFSQKECSYQKTYLAKVDESTSKLEADPFQDLVSYFGPLAAIFDFAGDERVPPM